ncbi:hypothetical protein F5Y15DRAFT_185548 [Xylariaceae sp. FL0016]|nr:hypothetical protein F5Y15DRAFT_185548 [Xylariaceae sp. FL0016]
MSHHHIHHSRPSSPSPNPSSPSDSPHPRKKAKVFSCHAAAMASSSTSAREPPSFTDEMRDEQARGKDYSLLPELLSSSSSDGGSGGETGGKRRKEPKVETFAVLQARRVARQVLDSPELLMMAAQRDDDSIPATRLRYMRMFCGMPDPATSGPSSGPGGPSSQSPRSAGRRKERPDLRGDR